MHRQQLVILPVAHQSKGVGDVAAQLILVGEGVGQLHLGSQLRCDPQQSEGFGIHGDFVSTLGCSAHGGGGKAPLGVVVIHEADFSVIFFKDAAGSNADNCPPSHGLDLGMGRQGLNLRLVYILEGTVGVGSHAAELVVLVGFVDGKHDGKKGCKQQSGQNDGNNGNEVPLPGGQQGFKA